MKYDVVIIGAGMSGLGAGIRLAHYGKKVCILEQHSISGGLNSHYAKDGLHFDVGLHAMTNFALKNNKKAPLNKLLRQLRISYDDLDLVEQRYSKIAFPDKTLLFSNDESLLDNEIATNFHHCINEYMKLKKYISLYNDVSLKSSYISAKKIVKSFIKDPLLVEMLFCPLMYYGSAQEEDMDFAQFCIMFKSIFLEGFCRPQIGVRQLLRILNKRYKEAGGEIRFSTPVKKIITTNNKVSAIELSDKTLIKTNKILSSAGLVETMNLVEKKTTDYPIGKLSFVETILLTEKLPIQKETIIFFNDSNKFHYQSPHNELVDYRSGVICYPNNFSFTNKPLNQGIVRITNLANYQLWKTLTTQQYQNEKQNFINKQIKLIEKMNQNSIKVTYQDAFTPLTIKKFTRHENGAIYGSPYKVKNGSTKYKNLYIIGTDQGFLGIVGALLSGISIANLYGLK